MKDISGKIKKFGKEYVIFKPGAAWINCLCFAKKACEKLIAPLLLLLFKCLIIC
jgi:hypothetical protein